MTQMINRSTAFSGFILLREPRQIKRPHGIAPTRVIPNSSKVTRNPFDNAANTCANIYSRFCNQLFIFLFQVSSLDILLTATTRSDFCNNYSAIETVLSYFSAMPFMVPSAFH